MKEKRDKKMRLKMKANYLKLIIWTPSLSTTCQQLCIRIPNMSVSLSEVSEGRIEYLAKPKSLPSSYTEDRRSVYWIDRRPIESNGKTEFATTPRLDDLSKPRNVDEYYQGDRPTPMWPVSKSARNAAVSERISELARYRPVHPEFQPERSPLYMPSFGSRSPPPPNSRIYILAQPKPHKVWSRVDENFVDEGEFSASIWPVEPKVYTSSCPPRVESLATAKDLPRQYKGERPVQWLVSDNAKNSTASLRLQQLARPRSGRLTKDDYDPYKVTPSARTARPTPRILELCTPLPRKIRQKKP
ncbi:hypothetical protein LSH36_375g04030 [Paralvinella palmiformis]|uniref:Testicular haploid expressed protein n=1 Tax=Paralvinella palmiformis TaxID=53620 RepID=A0AAD9MZ33_9ANNE|nr:hypothetical protein LSH36_375g04030 [Paralvinella palmiformis]